MPYGLGSSAARTSHPAGLRVQLPNVVSQVLAAGGAWHDARRLWHGQPHGPADGAPDGWQRSAAAARCGPHCQPGMNGSSANAHQLMATISAACCVLRRRSVTPLSPVQLTGVLPPMGWPGAGVMPPLPGSAAMAMGPQVGPPPAAAWFTPLQVMAWICEPNTGIERLMPTTGGPDRQK